MRFVSPHRSIINNSVSGTVSTSYINSWLTTSSPGYPARTDGAMSLTVSSVGTIDMVAVTHHNIAHGATVTVSGVGTIPTTAWRPDGIPRNYGLVLATPVSPGSITLSVSGGPVVVGMLYAGESYEIRGFQHGRTFSPQQPFPWEGEFSSLAPVDNGIAAQRRISGTVTLDDTEFENLLLTFEAQRMGNRPVLWLDDDLINDPWLCQFWFTEAHTEGWHVINLEIAEIPRLRWPV